MKKLFTQLLLLGSQLKQTASAKLLLLGSLVGLPAVVKAQSSSSTTIDTSAASTAVTELQTKVSDFITGDLLDAALAIIGAAVVIWLLFLAWRLVKKAGAKAG